MTNSKLALTTFFDFDTVEDNEAFTKVRVTAEITLYFRGLIHHVNTDEVRTRLQQAVVDAVWFNDRTCKPKEADGEK